MTASLIPWGKLAGGGYGILLDPTSNAPLAAAIEILTTLPAVRRSDNFDGRTVFVVPLGTAYVYASQPQPGWVALEGIPATVAHVNGSPPNSPIPQTGRMYFDLDTRVLFLWDGAVWRPVGGQYAAQFVQNVYTGDGTTTNFPTGGRSGIDASYVEVFLNGVRQYAPADYRIAGTNVVFVQAPAANVNILVRRLIRVTIRQTAQIVRSPWVATANQTDFRTGVGGSDPNRVWVAVDGAVQSLNVDYTVVEQDTTIASIVKTSRTVARATTSVAHGMVASQAFTIMGTNQSYYNARFTVLDVPRSTQFDFTVRSGAPRRVRGNPTMRFSPPAVNDIVRFLSPLVRGQNVDIRVFKNVVVGPGENETVTIRNVGTGEGLVPRPVGTAYQVKSVAVVAPLRITADSATVTISLAISSTATEINQLHGRGIQTTDLIKLHRVRARATELNYSIGVTRSIQGQLNRLTTQINGLDSIDLRARSYRIRSTEIASAFVFKTRGNRVRRTLTVPQVARTFMVWNTGRAVLSITLGRTTIRLPANNLVLLQSNGRANGLSALTRFFNPSLDRNAFDVAAFMPGQPAAGATVFRTVLTRRVQFAVNFAERQGYAATAATATATYNVLLNGSRIGRIVFAASARTATFTLARATTVHAGDVLRFVAPNPQDRTLRDISVTLTGMRV